MYTGPPFPNQPNRPALSLTEKIVTTVAVVSAVNTAIDTGLARTNEKYRRKVEASNNLHIHRNVEKGISDMTKAGFEAPEIEQELRFLGGNHRGANLKKPNIEYNVKMTKRGVLGQNKSAYFNSYVEEKEDEKKTPSDSFTQISLNSENYKDISNFIFISTNKDSSQIISSDAQVRSYVILEDQPTLPIWLNTTPGIWCTAILAGLLQFFVVIFTYKILFYLYKQSQSNSDEIYGVVLSYNKGEITYAQAMFFLQRHYNLSYRLAEDFLNPPYDTKLLDKSSYTGNEETSSQYLKSFPPPPPPLQLTHQKKGIIRRFFSCITSLVQKFIKFIY